MRLNKKSLNRNTGFTLLELVITIALVAIVTALAAPNLRNAIQNNRLTAQSNDFAVAMQLARTEAIKRGRPVSICASDVAGGGDDPECGDNWSLGWMVFVDAEGSAGNTSVTVEERIRVWRPVNDDIEVDVPDSVEFFRYLPRGNLDDASGATFPFVINMDIPGCTGDQVRQIRIVRTGSSSVTRVACT